MMQKKLFAAPLLAFILAGCPDSPSNPDSAGSITIAGIPQYIDDADAKAVYKIYVSVSDSTNDKDPHKAQGTKALSAADFKDGKASVTVDLYAPPPGAEKDPDPDKHGEPWSGEAKNFSVTICPQVVSSAADIKVKAGLTLNDSTRSQDWTKLIDLAAANMNDQINAIFTRIICKDGDEKDGASTGAGVIAGPEWESADGTIRFVIAGHGLFFCDLTRKLNMDTTVTGRLAPAEKTGEFLMQDMVSANEQINLMLANFNGAPVTIKHLNENQFTFSSENQTVQGFFGGTFNKAE
ncbi:MAG: hypothetical protein LBD55_05565 [Treponema sp.]|jgi:hypothetical protein|nr:hypothetical protein [Treponema sp.]